MALLLMLFSSRSYCCFASSSSISRSTTRSQRSCRSCRSTFLRSSNSAIFWAASARRCSTSFFITAEAADWGMAAGTGASHTVGSPTASSGSWARESASSSARENISSSSPLSRPGAPGPRSSATPKSTPSKEVSNESRRLCSFTSHSSRSASNSRRRSSLAASRFRSASAASSLLRSSPMSFVSCAFSALYPSCCALASFSAFSWSSFRSRRRSTSMSTEAIFWMSF
mmetsp:Transcript_10247/g.41736  ORF Transcript_10247/g.41736 Transcript_10247/m.41736 type:complete len:228 (-) Transcript_10247:1245-1928(-)